MIEPADRSPSLSSRMMRARYLRNKAKFSRVSSVYFSGQTKCGRFAFLFPFGAPGPRICLDCFCVARRVKAPFPLRGVVVLLLLVEVGGSFSFFLSLLGKRNGGLCYCLSASNSLRRFYKLMIEVTESEKKLRSSGILLSCSERGHEKRLILVEQNVTRITVASNSEPEEIAPSALEARSAMLSPQLNLEDASQPRNLYDDGWGISHSCLATG